MNTRVWLAVLVGALAWLPLVCMAAPTEVFRLDATSAEEFRQQSGQLRTQMQPGGPYAHLSDSDHHEVEKSLQRLQKLFNKRAAGKSLSNSDENALVNSHAQINAILSGKPEDRLICEQITKLGSNRTQRVRQTVAERERARADSQRSLRDRQHDRGGLYGN